MAPPSFPASDAPSQQRGKCASCSRWEARFRERIRGNSGRKRAKEDLAECVPYPARSSGLRRHTGPPRKPTEAVFAADASRSVVRHRQPRASLDGAQALYGLIIDAKGQLFSFGISVSRNVRTGGSARLGPTRLDAAVPAACGAAILDLLPVANCPASHGYQVAAHLAHLHRHSALSGGKLTLEHVHHFGPPQVLDYFRGSLT